MAWPVRQELRLARNLLTASACVPSLNVSRIAVQTSCVSELRGWCTRRIWQEARGRRHVCCQMVQVTSVVAVLADKEGETQGWTSNTETVCIENSVQFAVWGLGSFTRQRNHCCHKATYCKCLMGNVQNPGRQLPSVMEGEGRTGGTGCRVISTEEELTRLMDYETTQGLLMPVPRLMTR